MLCLCKGFRDFGGIAIVVIERDIVRHLVEHERGARLDRFGRLEHCGQRFDVERDRFGCIFRLRHGFRDRRRQPDRPRNAPCQPVSAGRGV